MKKIFYILSLCLFFSSVQATDKCATEHMKCYEKIDSMDLGSCESDKKLCIDAKTKKLNDCDELCREGGEECEAVIADCKAEVQKNFDCDAKVEECKEGLKSAAADQCKAKKEECEKKEASKNGNEDNKEGAEKAEESPKTGTTETTEKQFDSKFNPDKIFPGWDDQTVNGIIGKNRNSEGKMSVDKGVTKILLYFIPQFTTILLKIVAPVVVVMFIYAGVRFIYAGDDEEQLNASKSFFQFGIMGIVFIIFSYSLMKAVYYILYDPSASTVAIETKNKSTSTTESNTNDPEAKSTSTTESSANDPETENTETGESTEPGWVSPGVTKEECLAMKIENGKFNWSRRALKQEEDCWSRCDPYYFHSADGKSCEGVECSMLSKMNGKFEPHGKYEGESYPDCTLVCDENYEVHNGTECRGKSIDMAVDLKTTLTLIKAEAIDPGSYKIYFDVGVDAELKVNNNASIKASRQIPLSVYLRKRDGEWNLSQVFWANGSSTTPYFRSHYSNLEAKIIAEFKDNLEEYQWEQLRTKIFEASETQNQKFDLPNEIIKKSNFAPEVTKISPWHWIE